MVSTYVARTRVRVPNTGGDLEVGFFINLFLIFGGINPTMDADARIRSIHVYTAYTNIYFD